VLSRDAQLDRIRHIADRVTRDYGLEVFDVQLRRESIGWVLRIVIDRPPAASSGADAESVSIEDCQRVSQDVSAIIDVDEELGGPLEQKYTLEVSSPGLDRPLRGASDYHRFRGRLAKIVVNEAVDGQTHFSGRIQDLEDEVVLLAEGRRTHRIPLSAISRARLEVEF
jgi:ribosome maturation factor RimP